jgi:hypothetical protein
MSQAEKPTIAGLKKILPVEKNFSNIMDYFLRIAETNFRELDGEAAKGDLATIFQKVVSTVIGTTKGTSAVVLKNFLCVDVGHAQFVHGGAMTQYGMATFIYFRDLDQGMVSLAKLGSPQVQFARIKAIGLGVKDMKNTPPINFN